MFFSIVCLQERRREDRRRVDPRSLKEDMNGEDEFDSDIRYVRNIISLAKVSGVNMTNLHISDARLTYFSSIIFSSYDFN